MEKLYSSKTCLKIVGGRNANRLDPPMLTLISMSLTSTPTSRFCFSMMQGKFCQSCFEVTAGTTLVQFGHFTLKTRVRFQRRGFDPQTPDECATGATKGRPRTSCLINYETDLRSPCLPLCFELSG